MSMGFRERVPAVIFDVDGVLLALYPHMWRHYEAIAQHFGFSAHCINVAREREQSGEAPIPMDLRGGLVSVWGELQGQPETLDAVVALFHKKEREAPYPAIPGAKELLERLNECGVPLGLCTSNSMHALREKFDAAGIPVEWFSGFSTGEISPRKPDKRALLMVCRSLSVVPDRALYVGDTQGDARMALDAGVPFVGVRTGGMPQGEFERMGVSADRVLDSVADLGCFLNV